MLLLILFAFVAGIVTILSPCILPILPIVLAGSVTGGKRKPLGIVTGFIASFTFFTLFLSAIVTALHISADALRVFSIIVIFVFGLSLIIPQVQVWIEIFFSRISGKLSPKTQKDGFLAGVIVGLSLGLLWTPCVGPILASVISLALTGSVTTTAFFITLAYSIGTALPMLFITYTGRTIFQKIPSLLSRTKSIQQVFGVVMMLTAIGLMFNVDRKFQLWILQTFPQYGTGLTYFEETDTIQKQLNTLNTNSTQEKVQDMKGKPSFEMLEDLGKAPEIIPGGEWFNLPEGKTNLTIKELRGKVVLVDFWTYSCINCIRTFPYLKDWYQKYSDKGFVIIGVHSPEFEFEKNATNVGKAIKDFGILYPVVQDNNFATWKNFGDNSWPRHYLIDKDGVIREYHAGEGKYAETEQAIQQLLKQTGTNVDSVNINTSTYEVQTKTPETYLGLARTEGLASPEKPKLNEVVEFTHPENLALNEFSYQGKWMFSDEFATPSKDAELQFNFESMNVYLVMKPKKEGVSGKVEIYLDGKLLSTNPGSDINNGTITIDSDRLYTLLKQDKLEQHVVKIKFLDDNVEAFAFTFG